MNGIKSRRSILFAAFLFVAFSKKVIYGQTAASTSCDIICADLVKGCPTDCEKKSPCDLQCSNCTYPCGTTIFLPRSQGANTARELVGWQSQLYQPFFLENYATWAISTEYTRSFNPNSIADSLFCTNCLTFAGSARTDRTSKDVIADFFGLASDFQGSLFIEPSIENVIVDFNAYFGLNEFIRGLFLRFHAPVTYTKWDLGLDDCRPCCNKFKGHPIFPGCYMRSFINPSRCTPGTCSIQNPPLMGTGPSQPLIPQNPDNCPCPTNSSLTGPNCNCPLPNTQLTYTEVYTGEFHDFLNCTTHDLRVALSGNYTFGDMTEKWRYGRFPFCPKSKLELADIDLILGFAFIETDFSHFGLYSQLVVPTGNIPKAKYVFEPIAGNGHHWELGGGLTGHIMFATDNYINGSSASFWFEGNVTHTFTNNQIRSFDFKRNGRLSRYMLLKEYDVNNNYTGRMINAINFATRNCQVSVNYKIDLSAKLAFTFNFWMLDIGYNFYMKDAEKVCIKTECPCAIDQRRFGIKGIAGVCCIPATVVNSSLVPSNGETGIDSTDQPNATMFNVIQLPGTDPSTLSNGDTVCLSYATPASLKENTTPLNEITQSQLILSNTATPYIVSCWDLDPNSAAQASFLSNKLFWHLGYMWEDYCYKPHIGIGGEVEFGYKDCNTGLSQWGIWIKGGITF